jgi:apolipoprotein N-acyltransferase
LKINFSEFLLPIFASVSSGILLLLAFPIYNVWWLAWLGLVPLLIAIHEKGKMFGFLLSLTCGVFFTAGIFNWILAVSGYELYHHVILVFYLALYFGVFGLIFAFIAKRWGITPAFLTAPFLWVSLEYIKSNLSFLALPWALLAYSQHQVSSVIQIASLTGAYGVSFLIVLVNSTLTLNIIAYSGRRGWHRLSAGKIPSRGEIHVATFSTVAIIILSIVFGLMVLSKQNNIKDIKVSVLQGDIEQSKKWDHKYAQAIMKKYTDLSRGAAVDKPRLIVWPEAATPGFILKDMVYYKQITSLVKETKTYYLIGSSEYPKFPQASLKMGKGGNSAVFFSPDSKVIGQYFKIHLVPFVEYIPYDRYITWPRFIVRHGKTTWEIQGKEFTLFEIDGTRFGVSICWESLFPDLFREFLKQGAGFMLNISSEAWFGVSAFQYQFLAATKFRAVENRTAIARAGNYTISCFIDPYGRILEKFPVNSRNKKNFGQGHLTQKITISEEKTFYTIYGDIFTYIVLTVTVFLIIFTFFRVKIYRNIG